MLFGSALLLTTALASAEVIPGVEYDPRIPTLQQVLGHDFGEEISSPDAIVRYLNALQDAAPDRARLLSYGTTWEGRPLHVFVVGSADRIAALDALRTKLSRLADPRLLTAAEADGLMKDLPVVVWLLHAVHGNEASSSDAALFEAYHLLAARADPGVDLVLKEALVLIDPLENPDGRARFLAAQALGRAIVPDPEPWAIEHDEPWPGGRGNHYLFDMNRDWFAGTQPETRGRRALFLRWFPHVVVDLHEMGGEATYYFAPPAAPENPHFTRAQHDWLEAFGRANAARFDERGFSYFIRETFDSFYPGYGESWPIFHGAVGMTYEQASARGLRYRREDGTILTYRDGVVRHATAALTTLETAARNRDRLLRDFLEYRRSAVAEAERGAVREYLLLPGSDPARTERLAALLVEQGIEVRRAEEPVKAGGRQLPTGTFVVPVAQPAGRLVRNLLDPKTALDETFVKEQDRRRKKRLPDEIYDVTAWSLPLIHDVEVIASDRPSVGRQTLFTPRDTVSFSLPPAKVGYLVPWGVGAAAAVAEALQAGLRVRTADEPFTLGGRRFPLGTAFIPAAENGPGLVTRLAPILSRHAATAVATDSGWVEEGISLGSSRMRGLKAIRVAVGWDAPASSLSAGWARYVLERRYGQPVTAVRVSSFRRLDLRRYDVLILPSGDYADALGEEAVRRLKDWIRGGGTLITLGEATRWASREKVGLLETRSELRGGRPETEPSEKDKDKAQAPKSEDAKPFDLEKAIEPERERPETTPGALLHVDLDTEHWLSAGSDGEIQALVESQRVLTPIKLDKGHNVGLFATKDRLVASGLVWKEAQEQLAQKAYLIDQPMGEGRLVAFSEDPNHRGYAEATELILMNAVLLGPAH